MTQYYIPSPHEEYMNEKQLQYFKARLLELKEDYHKISAKKINLLHNKQKNTNSILIEVDLLNEDKHSNTLKEIDDALARIKDGSYGFCEDTGKEIGVERLKIAPFTRYCVAAQERHDRQNEMMYKVRGNSYGFSSNEEFD